MRSPGVCLGVNVSEKGALLQDAGQVEVGIKGWTARRVGARERRIDACRPGKLVGTGSCGFKDGWGSVRERLSSASDCFYHTPSAVPCKPCSLSPQPGPCEGRSKRLSRSRASRTEFKGRVSNVSRDSFSISEPLADFALGPQLCHSTAQRHSLLISNSNSNPSPAHPTRRFQPDRKSVV